MEGTNNIGGHLKASKLYHVSVYLSPACILVSCLFVPTFRLMYCVAFVVLCPLYVYSFKVSEYVCTVVYDIDGSTYIYNRVVVLTTVTFFCLNSEETTAQEKERGRFRSSRG